MARFYMTDDEIRRDYTKARDRKHQIGILADMNCVSKAVMRNKLIELGLILGDPTKEEPQKETADQKIDENRARALIAGDVSDEDIAKEFDVSVQSFQNWRRHKGIMRYPKSRKKEDKLMENSAERAKAISDEEMADKLENAEGKGLPGQSSGKRERVEQVNGEISLSDLQALLHELRQLPWNLGDAKLMINGEVIKDVYEISICRGKDLCVDLTTRC